MRALKFRYNSTGTDLDHSFLVHGDAIVGILGQLVQSHDCALVD